MCLYLIYFNKQKYTDMHRAFFFLFLMQESYPILSQGDHREGEKKLEKQ